MTNQQLIRRVIPTTVLALTLAACGGGGGGGGSTVVEPPKVTVTAQEDKFGTAFGTDFRAALFSEPVSVSDGDIVPVSLTTEPIDITP